MKRIVYCLTILGITFFGCNPLEDIYNETDQGVQPIVGTDTYTLTSDDYDGFDLGFGNFNSVQQAKDSIPQLLDELYPFWGNGSSVVVNYNLYIGNAEGLSNYTGADVYQFSNSDYALTGSDAFGFYPNVDASSEIPTVLNSQIVDPVDGQFILAEYKQYFETPQIGIADIYAASFPTDFGNFELKSITGLDELGWTEDTGFVVGSGWNGAPNAVEEWLVSPQIDLSAQSDLLLEITQEIDFLDDDALIDILVSTDYTTGGDVTAATWTAIDFDKMAFGSMSSSGDMDFSDYDGEQIHVAFKYSSTSDESPRWRVESFAIKALGVSGERDTKGEYFMYNGGEWEASEGVYYLSVSDYDAMGEGSGQPGQYNNFSSSVSADNYVPTLLNQMLPFAQEEEELFVIYKYFSSSCSCTQTRGNLYTVTSGVWTSYASTIEESLQFGHDGTTWVPDNTIRYTLTGPDYDVAAAALLTEPGFEAAAGNLENYGNFNRSGGSTNWTDEMVVTALNIILDNLNPNAEEGQKYILTISTWAPGDSTEEWAMIKEGGEWIVQGGND